MKNVSLDLMFIISPRNYAEKVLEEIKGLVTLPSITLAKGTASSDIMSALGLSEPEKDLIICFCEYGNIKKVYSILQDKLDFKSKRGIAFTMPISAVSGNLTLNLLLDKIK